MALQTGWIKNTDGSPYTYSTNPNSVKITYPAGAALADLMDTVEHIITGGGYDSGTPANSTTPFGGWSLWDSAAGTNSRAYRALNKDGETYKYVVLNYNNAYANSVTIKIWETWNEVTHAGTNQAASNDTSANAQKVDLTNGGSLYVMTNPRWLILVSFVGGVWGGTSNTTFSGCGEASRDLPEDTVAANLPCSVALSTSMTNVSTPVSGLMCKNLSGGTGSNVGSGLISPIGMVGQTGTGFQLLYPFTSKYQAFNLSILVGNATGGWGNQTSAGLKGRIFGLKLMGPTGAYMDEATLKVDEDYFLDLLGTATTHLIMVTSTYRWAIPK